VFINWSNVLHFLMSVQDNVIMRYCLVCILLRLRLSESTRRPSLAILKATADKQAKSGRIASSLC
jgi:hypothetical protein